MPVLTPGPRSFRVRSSNACGDGPLSSVQNFTVLDCASFPDKNLENTVVSGAVTERACGTITAGNLGAGDYVINGAANVLFHAGSQIAIHNGFKVLAGAFTAVVDY